MRSRDEYGLPGLPVDSRSARFKHNRVSGYRYIRGGSGSSVDGSDRINSSRDRRG